MPNARSILFVSAALGALYFFPQLREGASALTSPDDFNKWDTLFKRYGQNYSIPWRWLKAIAMQESALGKAPSVAIGLKTPGDVEGSKSSDGKSWGLMQLTLPTAKGLLGYDVDAEYLNNPSNSIELAAMLVAQLVSRFGIDDRESVIRAYNGGPNFGALTIPYYSHFLANIAVVLSANPGEELEA